MTMEEIREYTDHREFRNELNAYLNAGVRLEVLFDNGLMRIKLLEEDDAD